MTTTEAIKQLQTEHDLIAGEYDLDGSQFAPALLEALAMAIDVLKCSEIPNCSEPKCADGCIYGWGSSECGHCDYRSEEPKTGDTISRKAAIDEIKAVYEWHDVVTEDRMIQHFKALPPAQPEREKGEWIRITQGAMPEQYICPFCHRTVETYGVEELLSIRYPYCHCGADMRGEQDE